MSKMVFPSTGLRMLHLPRHKLSSCVQLSQCRKTLLNPHSRASYSWAALPSTKRLYRPNACSRCQTEQRSPFSTSIATRQDHKKVEDNAVSNQNRQEPTTSKQPNVASKTLESLKARIPNLKSRHENIYTLPNILTFSRLLATPLIGYLIIHNHHLYAFGLFAYAGFSDLLDGWIARKWNLQTVVGSVVDPMADKALMTTLVTCLAVNGSLPLPLATVILGRDVSLAIAAIYYRYASLPAPKTFARYWDFSLPSAEVHPTTLSKYNTFLQLVLIGTTLCVNLLHDPSAIASAAGGYLLSIQESLGGEEGVKTMIQGMQVVVAGTTVWSGLSYSWLKNAVTILGEDEVLKRKQGFRGRMIIGGCFGSVVLLAIGLAWRDFLNSEEEAMNESHD